MYVGIEYMYVNNVNNVKKKYWSSECLILINFNIFQRLWSCTPQGLYSSLLLEIDIDQM